MYAGNKIDTIILYSRENYDSGALIENRRYTFHYNGNNITKNQFCCYNASGKLLENYDTISIITYETDGEKILKVTKKVKNNITKKLEKRDLTEYSYNGEKLKTVSFYSVYKGEKIKWEEYVYIYENDLLTNFYKYRLTGYEEIDGFRKVEEINFQYKDEKIDTITLKTIKNDGTVEINRKEVYEYKNGVLQKYSWYSTNKSTGVWEKICETEYIYNKKGMVQCRKYNENSKAVFEWEEKKGNISFFDNSYKNIIGTEILKSTNINCPIQTVTPIPFRNIYSDIQAPGWFNF
ncbi:MAG: hypothetical protein K9H26_03675 [Prolixibacteraceae bacterium]|nr:hypothetical protein [Prolixibacteraceae bacterium]